MSKVSEERIFKVRSIGRSPEEDEKIIKLIEGRVEKTISEIFFNLPFILDISELLSAQQIKNNRS